METNKGKKMRICREILCLKWEMVRKVKFWSDYWFNFITVAEKSRNLFDLSKKRSFSGIYVPS